MHVRHDTNSVSDREEAKTYQHWTELRRVREERSRYDQNEHGKPNRPVRNFKERKDLRGDLNQQPADNGIRDRNLVHVAPPQLVEEVA